MLKNKTFQKIISKIQAIPKWMLYLNAITTGKDHFQFWFHQVKAAMYKIQIQIIGMVPS